jgi:hypothetical protein
MIKFVDDRKYIVEIDDLGKFYKSDCPSIENEDYDCFKVFSYLWDEDRWIPLNAETNIWAENYEKSLEIYIKDYE